MNLSGGAEYVQPTMRPAAPIQMRPEADTWVSHRPAATTSASSTTPNTAVSRIVSTPFWMKRLPPVNGNTRSVLIASVPLSAS